MKFLDLLRLSSSSLLKRKVRTILTVLGVTIGVASIVVMVSLGLGLNKSSLEEMESYGSLTAITVYEPGSYYDPSMATSDSQEEKRLDDARTAAFSGRTHEEQRIRQALKAGRRRKDLILTRARWTFPSS